MTNINCASNCKHQSDGKCTLDNATDNLLSAETDCVFFEEKMHFYNYEGNNKNHRSKNQEKELL